MPAHIYNIGSNVFRGVTAVALVLGVGLTSASAAHAHPTEINSCVTITKPGSYVLAGDIVYGGAVNGTCIAVMVSKVSINLDGHTMSWPVPRGPGAVGPAAIASAKDTEHVTVRNGVISGFGAGVTLLGSGSTVEDIHVGGPCPCQGFGIDADGVIKNNVVSVASVPDLGFGGMHVQGVIEGNYIYDTRSYGMVVDANSTVRGNTITDTAEQPGYGMVVACPSTVAHNTVTGSQGKNLVLNGTGCTVKDNTAP